jgi:carbon storage regulator
LRHEAGKERRMLTLTRKAGQKIRIGDDIEIVVREIRGRQVRLGISAPDGLTVYREELYQQILAEGGTEDSPGLNRRARVRGEGDETIVEVELPDDVPER